MSTKSAFELALALRTRAEKASLSWSVLSFPSAEFYDTGCQKVDDARITNVMLLASMRQLV
jgi:hypothetical protein